MGRYRMVEEEIYNGQRGERARQRAQCKKVPKRNKYGKLLEDPNRQALTLAYTVYRFVGFVRTDKCRNRTMYAWKSPG